MSKIKRTFKHKDDKHEYTVRVVLTADVTMQGEKMRSSARMQQMLTEAVEKELKKISYWFDPAG
jgi:hypothetical protein